MMTAARRCSSLASCRCLSRSCEPTVESSAREELFASCAGLAVVVGEDALSRVIGRLRRLADDLGAEAFKLETITKVGYRLTPLASAGEGAAPDASIPPTVRERSICVLPFANMSDDLQQDYFSDGISEDIITDLSKVSSLFVVARTTAFTFRDRNIDVPRLASELSVGHVLEGSVRKAEGRVRITAQLIDGGVTGGHVWGRALRPRPGRTSSGYRTKSHAPSSRR